MKILRFFYPAALFLLVGAAAPASPVSVVPIRPVLTRAGAIALPGVEGRMDHFAFDEKTGRLFISALENRTLEVVNVRTRQRVKSIIGLNEPQGILFLPQFGRVFVGSRGDGTMRTFDTRTWREGAWADLGRNADNVRFDGRDTLFVGSNGEPGAGSFDAIDLHALLPLSQGGKPFEPRSPADLLLSRPRRADARSSVGLSSHPESFQIDAARHRAYVNVPDEHIVAVIDTRTMRVLERWPVPFRRNFPLALSASRNRVFVACRNPARFLVYRENDGKLLSQQPCVGDADDIYFDSKSGRLFLIGGEGKINVFDARNDTPKLLQTVTTAPRTRTGIYLPTLQMLAVAVPKTPTHRPEIRLFKVAP